MQRPTFLSALLPLAGLAQGCCTASTNILPQEASARIVSESASESCAIEKAQEEAAEYCKKMGKQYVSIKSDSKYQGADPNAKLALSLLSRNSMSGNRHNDYRVEIEFRCD
jgi:hypothetical protein